MNNTYKQLRVSVIIPILDEQANINELVLRLDKTLASCTKSYELIFIDDNSLDHSLDRVQQLTKRYPVSYYLKIGKKGKSYSLLQGFKLARYENIVMIDADLQYPPEAIREMLKVFYVNNLDIVLTVRQKTYQDFIRSVGSRVNSYINRYIFGLNYDVQSGLKLFKKDILSSMLFNNVGPWTFDISFLRQAVAAKYKIGSVNIKFSKRRFGYSKISYFKIGLEIFYYILKTRSEYLWKTIHIW